MKYGLKICNYKINQEERNSKKQLRKYNNGDDDDKIGTSNVNVDRDEY